MNVFRWIAALVLFLQLPIPLYWFVVHPKINFWRRHRRAVYVVGLIFSWGVVTPILYFFRHSLLKDSLPTIPAAIAGTVLIVLEGWIFWRVKADLGAEGLVGKTELSGGGEIIARGIYAKVRHPRYAGSFVAIVGACILAGTRVAWVVTVIWAALMFAAIRLEEREMRARFGEAFEEYCRRVPRFFPLRDRGQLRANA